MSGWHNEQRPRQEFDAVEFMRGDAVIVTGGLTGDPPKPADIAAVKKRTRLPVYLGSGVTAKNLKQFFLFADGLIVGSHFKEDGYWSRPVDAKRTNQFMSVYVKLARID